MSVRLKSLIWAWLPVVVWLSIIFIESTDLMSSAHTGRILYAILTRFLGPIDHAHFAIFHAALRKIGHFAGYGILGILFFRAIRETVSELNLGTQVRTEKGRQPHFRWACEAVFCTFLVAAFDEWHQTMLPSRTGAFHDVVLDTVGAVVLILVVVLRYPRSARTSQTG